VSSYRVLAAVSDGLRRILWDAIRQDRTTRKFVTTEEAIVFQNPTETARDSSQRISLWLYHIAENEFVKNQPEIRLADGTEQFPPLALDLYYLLTPFGPSGEADHLLVGKAMQAFYDNAIVLLVNDGARVFEELRIALFRRTLEELTRVWEALREPYRLSVCYQVQLSRVDSERARSGERVVELQRNYFENVEPIMAGT
jgi:hypothetical protein